jgi:hypothetical protein
VQRWKQYNIGMQTRLREDELLIAQGPVFPNRGNLRRVRMRVERGGYAEMAFYEIDPKVSVFVHRSGQFDVADLIRLDAALQVAYAANESSTGDDPNGMYRTIEFWRNGELARLCVEYRDGVASPAAPVFEEVWRLIHTQFPTLE